MLFTTALYITAAAAAAIQATPALPPWNVTYFQYLSPRGGNLGPWNYKINTTIEYHAPGKEHTLEADARRSLLTTHCNATWPLETSAAGIVFDCDDAPHSKWTFTVDQNPGFNLTITEVVGEKAYVGLGHFERGVNLRPAYAASGNYWEYLMENVTVLIQPEQK